MRWSTKEKQSLVARYQAGESVAEICADTGIARSTFYTWIKPYTTTTTDSGYVVSQQEFIKMKQRIQKLEQKVEILQKVGCTASAPLQEKLQELAKLYGQYSVHALCEALCVSRGTFYNHIFRRKEVTAYDKRRAEMKEHIKAVSTVREEMILLTFTYPDKESIKWRSIIRQSFRTLDENGDMTDGEN